MENKKYQYEGKLFAFRNLSMARKQQTRMLTHCHATLTFPAICIESLPHIYALDTSAQNPTTRFQYHRYDTALYYILFL